MNTFGVIIVSIAFLGIVRCHSFPNVASNNETKVSEDEEKLKQILGTDEDVNYQDSYGYTELHRAAKFGNSFE